MKFFATLLIFISVQVQATEVISHFKKGDTTIQGFHDSTFLYEKAEDLETTTFCYNGNLYDVCAEVQKGVDEISQDYSQQGAHDYLNLHSCQIQGLTVEVKYEIGDDYGWYLPNITRTIPACTGF